MNRNLLAWATCATMLVSLYLIFMYAPTEATMGDVQRIFYFHFASHWVNFLAISCVFIYSVRFLIQREKELDVKASSAAEVGFVFATIGLLTGMLWAKPVWGIWWTWDARLTSFFVLWLMYWGYLMLRHMVESPEQRARLSAVFGVLGAVDVPIIYISNRIWRTQHPAPVIAGGEGSGLDPRMAWTLAISFLAFTLLYFYLWKMRQDLERAQETVESLQRQAHTTPLDQLVGPVYPKLVRIGGWLVLPAIGFVLGPIVGVVGLIVALAAGSGPLYTLELGVHAGLLAFVIYAATRFFGKKSNAPSTIIALMITSVIASGLLLVAGAREFALESGKQLVRDVIDAAIWIPYFRVSKRVKATFVK